MSRDAGHLRFSTLVIAFAALALMVLAGCCLIDGHHDEAAGVLCLSMVSSGVPALPMLALVLMGWATVAAMPSVLSAAPPVRLPPPKLARS